MRRNIRQTRTSRRRNQSHTRTGAQVHKRRRRVREAATLLFIMAMIALFCVWSRVEVLQAGYRIHDKVERYQELQEEYRTLRLELATRKTPQNLVPLARKQLGLRQPKPQQAIVLPNTVRFANQGR